MSSLLLAVDTTHTEPAVLPALSLQGGDTQNPITSGHPYAPIPQERTGKGITTNYAAILAIILVMLLAIPVVADDLEKGIEKPTIAVQEKPIEKVVKYQPVEILSDDLIKKIMQSLGLAPKEQKVAVYFGERVLGIIPPESKFNGVELTNECLYWQYGTDKWYECEQELSK